MKDTGISLGVTNISDLVIEEIHSIYGKKELTKEEIKNYKMREKEIYKKFDNLSKDELNTYSNKFVYVKNNIMTNIITVEVKKKWNKSNRWIYKKINDSRL